LAEMERSTGKIGLSTEQEAEAVEALRLGARVVFESLLHHPNLFFHNVSRLLPHDAVKTSV
jgi:hypothetical protein